MTATLQLRQASHRSFRRSTGFEVTAENVSMGGMLRGRPLIFGHPDGYVYFVRNIDTGAVNIQPTPTTPILVRTERGLVPEIASALEGRDSTTIAVIETFSPRGEWLLEGLFRKVYLREGAGGIMFQMRSDSNDVLQAHVFSFKLSRPH